MQKTPHLARVKAARLASREQKHVDELDQDAGSGSGGLRGISQPLVEDHEYKVPEDAEHEEKFWDGNQVDIELLPEMPGKKVTRQPTEKAGLRPTVNFP